jgi:alpha-tubulin suppressor-like RCC1 family protein
METMKAIYLVKVLLKTFVLTAAFSIVFNNISSAQSESNNPVTYDTTITEHANNEGPYTWTVRITRQKSDPSPRPAFFSMPGSGEIGSNQANLVKYGPHYWLANGWDGSVKLGNGTHYPILVTVLQPAANMRPWHLKAVLETLLALLPIKKNSVHVAGLSEGSYEWGELISYAASAGDQTAMSEIKSWVNLEGVGPGDNFSGFNQAYPASFATWASKYGGKLFGLEGNQDSRNVWQISQAMNAASANSAYFSYETIGGGGHCCWNSMYDPSVTNWQCLAPVANANIAPSSSPANTMGDYSVNKSTGTNIFQWMLRQGDTSLVSGGTQQVTHAPPVANAGGDPTLTLPANSIALSGSATDVGGTIVTYAWTKVSGPTQFSISNPAISNPVISNLIAGNYIFKLTVTDNFGMSSSSTIAINVNPTTTSPAAIPGMIEAEAYSAMTGVQTQPTTDAGGGLNVGYIDKGDWMNYSVSAVAAGTYTASFRVAAIAAGAGFQLKNSSGAILATITVPNTGNFQTFQTVNASVTLPAGSQTLQIASTGTAQWNINWMQFTSAAGAAAIPGTIQAEAYNAMSGVQTQTTTDGGGGLNVGYIDKGDWMNYAVNVASAGSYTVSFRIATPNAGAILQLRQSSGTVLNTVNLPNTGGFQTWQTVNATVTLPAGSQTLQVYSNAVPEWNFNWIQFTTTAGATAIPGTIQAEAYSTMSGVQTQTTTDAGSGQNVGFIDKGDWMNYPVNVATAGTYTVSFRVATPNTGAAVQLKQSSGTVLATVTVPNTGGFQTWQTVNSTVTLAAGSQTLQVYSSGTAEWNINWLQFAASTAATPPTVNAGSGLSITLPVSTVNLSASATGNGGATISKMAWSVKSGPNTPIIVSLGSLATPVTGLIQGTYTFNFTATDNKGTAASSAVNVTVGAAGGVTIPPVIVGAPPILVATGEYQVFFLDQSKHIYAIGTNPRTIGAGGNGVVGTTLPLAVPASVTFKSIAGALHGGGAVDVNGNAWTWGDNAQGENGDGTVSASETVTPVQIKTDNSGNPFTGVSSLNAFFAANESSGWYAVKSNGTLWVWGQTLWGMEADGTMGQSVVSRPLQVPVPGGRQVAQVVAGQILIVLCTDGTVWTCGGAAGNPQDLGYAATGTNYLSLHQLTTLSGITQIAGGSSFNYALKSDGTLYGWGYFGFDMGTGIDPIPAPTNLSSVLTLPHPVKSIVTNMACTHAILTDGTLWGWGDNGNGTIGNGKELNYATTAEPYAWDFNPYDLLQQTPVQITTRNDFVAVFGAQPFVLYTYAETSGGLFYSWGRNKTGVLGNGVVGCNPDVVAAYPNSWDVPTPTLVNPLTVTKLIITPSPYCKSNPSGVPCNECSTTTAATPGTGGVAEALALSTGTVEQVLAYPTLAHDNVNLRVSSDSMGTVHIAVYDLTGKKVQAQELSKQDIYLEKSLNVSALPAGMYVIQVLIGERKRLVAKFVKQ